VVEIADLQTWVAERTTPAAGRIATLLARIAAPRSGLADGPRLMGIVNVTPDSFSDGGEHIDAAAALAHCRELASAGAGILDIGGESTRPGAAPVSPAEELARVLPVLEGLQAVRGELPAVEFSIDTRHSLVMRAATTAGADIINDVTALAGDPAALATAAASSARVVLMHMQGEPATMNLAPAYSDVALDVFDFLEARIEACVAAGIDRQRLIVDPGIGFGKRSPENLAILRALPLFHGLGCPILLGVSRKWLIGGMTSVPPKQRLPTSLAAAMHALSHGVQMLRVHDVAETHQVVELWRRLNEASA
jgi:dihydropteroate synthase